MRNNNDGNIFYFKIMKATNKCKLCGKRYKLSQYEDSVMRIDYFCFTCEVRLQSIDLLLELIRRQSGVSLPTLLKQYKEYKKINGTTTTTKKNDDY